MMTWSMLARGASGFFYFIGKPPAALWAAQGRCARDIRALVEPATAARREPLAVLPEDSGVYADFRETDEAFWIIAVNEREQGAQIEIRLPEEVRAGQVEVWRETRRVAVPDGRLRDAFAPFQSRAYRIPRGR